MSETYRGWHLADAFTDQVALYNRGSFMGHFADFAAARQFVDREIANSVGLDPHTPVMKEDL